MGFLLKENALRIDTCLFGKNSIQKRRHYGTNQVSIHTLLGYQIVPYFKSTDQSVDKVMRFFSGTDCFPNILIKRSKWNPKNSSDKGNILIFMDQDRFKKV